MSDSELSIEGINSFANLRKLHIESMNLQDPNIDGLQNLEILRFRQYGLANCIITNAPALESIDLDTN